MKAKQALRRAVLHGLDAFAPELDDSLVGIDRDRSLLADFPFNIALGRAVQLYVNVDTNSPANSVLVLLVIDTSASDATLTDLDTVALVLADGDTAEVTNTNYARKVLTDSDIASFAPDDANDRTDLDIPDQSWTAVTAGDSWTDAIIAYDDDSTGGDDSDLIPISQHDFEATPDGSDINLVVAAAGFYRAAAA